MALSVVDLYRDVLPQTNCGDCGFPTCLAFAGMVVSEKYPLKNCPHLRPEVVAKCRVELEKQYAAGKWLKRDMAGDALEWARRRSAVVEIADLPDRIGGQVKTVGGRPALELPYFNDVILVTAETIRHRDGTDLTRWEQVFVYNHLAQGGRCPPTGKWKGLVEFPNTVSKIKSMIDHVENPLVERFRGRRRELAAAADRLGGRPARPEDSSADVAIRFLPLPRVPVLLLFWDEGLEDGFSATAKLLFDETITDHLDIESILFLSERLRELLCEPLPADNGNLKQETP